MKKIAIFCALLLGVSATANAATAVNPRGQSASGTTNTASTTGTRTGTAAARSATTARSATGTRSSTTTSTTARSATAGRTTVSRTPTSASTSSTTSTARSATVAARAGATQKVIGTGTTVAAANENVVVSEACRQKYYGCMDSFCMLDNDSGGRCICSDKNAEYDDILAQIEALDLQSYQMATYGVERIEMGDAADVAIANANAVAQSIMNDTSKEKEKKSLDLTSWLSPVDFSSDDVFADTGTLQSPIEGKEGDALFSASNQICVQQMPECESELSMLQLMYAQQIRSDCTAYENSLKQQKNASAQKLYAAEQALREAALEQYQSANKYDLGQCTVEFKNCMISTGGCGEDFSGCASIAAFDSTSTRGNKKASTYEIQGTVTSIEIQASTYDILLSKKPLCESVTKQCQLVADQVWDTFLKEVAPQVKSAELIAENNARQNCIGNISSCFQQACKDTMDPNDPDGSYDLCLTRPETMLNLCQVPLNACGISTASAEDAQESDIWDFVVARLASMRVNSCTAQFKECLQSTDRCGEDYTQCIGLDTDTIMRMCPYDTLVGCQQVYGETDIRGEAVYDELYSVAQGIFLNIDNNLLEECQNAANEAMIKVCGDTENCNSLTVDENIGARSLEYKICEYSNSDNSLDINYSACRTDVSQILDSELGRVEGGTTTGLGDVTPFAGVIDGLIYWESVEIDEDGRLISVDDYLNNVEKKEITGGAVSVNPVQKEKISSELAVLQSNIDSAINAIEADPQVQFCMTGRTVDGINNRTVVDRSGSTKGRFPELTKQMRMIIANAALKSAKDNYYKKYDELNDRMLQDYTTIGERVAEIEGENALDARRELAREACVTLSEFSSLPKSPEPPANTFGKMLAVTSGVLALAFIGYGDSNGNDVTLAEGDLSERQMVGSTQLNQWNYKETITSTFEWDTLVCHKCTRTQQCSKIKNPWFGNKYCKTWADPVETCTDTQF